MNHRYTPEEVEFLTETVKGGASQKETAARFNEKFGLGISVGVLAMKCYDLGLGKGKRGKRRKSMKIGDEVVITRTSGMREIYVKIGEPRILKPKSHIVWEQSHGSPVPEDHIIIFLDRNGLNCTPDNLAMISRAVNARMNQNGLRFSDRELTETAINISRVLAETGKARRRCQRE